MKDYLKKEPSKNEKMFYELAMHMQHLDRNLVTNSAFVAILAIVLKIEPKVVAEYLTVKRDEVTEYSKKINEAIDELEKANKKQDDKGEDHTGHNH